MNLANKLTVLRMVIIPVFLVFMLTPMPIGELRVAVWRLPVAWLVAALLFAAASITDWFDGRIARGRGLVTNFGKLMDPLADKLLVMSAFVAFVGVGAMPSWMVIVILAREFAVTGLRLVAVEEGSVIAASKIAKWKTFTQMVTILLYLLDNFPFGSAGFPLDYIALWLAVALTVVSGVDYFYKNREIVWRSK
ncbi:MAG: CDP-diacylglycerol--glycerol-3-phosphate 3-phosphatidyltransferase [Sporolactobacillus sp.]